MGRKVSLFDIQESTVAVANLRRNTRCPFLVGSLDGSRFKIEEVCHGGHGGFINPSNESKFRLCVGQNTFFGRRVSLNLASEDLLVSWPISLRLELVRIFHEKCGLVRLSEHFLRQPVVQKLFYLSS
jgi:hypothetical protein